MGEQRRLQQGKAPPAKKEAGKLGSIVPELLHCLLQTLAAEMHNSENQLRLLHTT